VEPRGKLYASRDITAKYPNDGQLKTNTYRTPKTNFSLLIDPGILGECNRFFAVL
jgi:hypothetical protein